MNRPITDLDAVRREVLANPDGVAVAPLYRSSPTNAEVDRWIVAADAPGKGRRVFEATLTDVIGALGVAGVTRAPLPSFDPLYGQDAPDGEAHVESQPAGLRLLEALALAARWYVTLEIEYDHPERGLESRVVTVTWCGGNDYPKSNPGSLFGGVDVAKRDALVGKGQDAESAGRGARRSFRLDRVRNVRLPGGATRALAWVGDSYEPALRVEEPDATPPGFKWVRAEDLGGGRLSATDETLLEAEYVAAEE